MLKKFLLKFSTFAAATIFIAEFVYAQDFQDNDWNVKLHANCGLPKGVEGEKPIRWVNVNNDRMLLFTLKEGQVGTCPTDNMARHSAPFWERAEVMQHGFLDLGQISVIKFEAIFQEGFTGRQEAFFQIHGWNEGCRAYPPVMLFFDKGILTVWALRGVSPDAGQEWISSSQGRHFPTQRRKISIIDLIGRATSFEIRFDAREKGRLSVYVNGSPVVENTSVEYAPCAKPHIKLGVYRPGGSGSKRSTVIFDNIKVETTD